MRSAMRSADMPGPGSRCGHDVTMRQRRVCAMPTDGAAIAALSPAEPAINLRRVSFIVRLPNRYSPPVMKMMHRTVTLADRKLVGGLDCGCHIGLGGAHGLAQRAAFGKLRRNRR